MGYAKEVLAEAGQNVKGVIIAQVDDPNIRRAVFLLPMMEFRRCR